MLCSWLTDSLARSVSEGLLDALTVRPATSGADGNLYTGQNPQSARALAERILADLS